MRIVGFIPFPGVLAQCEMQTTLSRNLNLDKSVLFCWWPKKHGHIQWNVQSCLYAKFLLMVSFFFLNWEHIIPLKAENKHKREQKYPPPYSCYTCKFMSRLVDSQNFLIVWSDIRIDLLWNKFIPNNKMDATEKIYLG